MNQPTLPCGGFGSDDDDGLGQARSEVATLYSKFSRCRNESYCPFQGDAGDRFR